VAKRSLGRTCPFGPKQYQGWLSLFHRRTHCCIFDTTAWKTLLFPFTRRVIQLGVRQVRGCCVQSGQLERMRTPHRRELGFLLLFAIAAICLFAGYLSTTSALRFTSWLPTSKAAKLAKHHGQHTFRDDGLLEVNPAANHPIFELVQRAEAAWQHKLDRASTTFPQAVTEYRRRYNRDPPKGFDDWYVWIIFVRLSLRHSCP
jgi:hypothetical protein